MSHRATIRSSACCGSRPALASLRNVAPSALGWFSIRMVSAGALIWCSFCPRHGVVCIMRPGLCPRTCSAGRVGIGVEGAADALLPPWPVTC